MASSQRRVKTCNIKVLLSALQGLLKLGLAEKFFLLRRVKTCNIKVLLSALQGLLKLGLADEQTVKLCRDLVEKENLSALVYLVSGNERFCRPSPYIAPHRRQPSPPPPALIARLCRRREHRLVSLRAVARHRPPSPPRLCIHCNHRALLIGVIARLCAAWPGNAGKFLAPKRAMGGKGAQIKPR